jgi:hypothetical protein
MKTITLEKAIELLENASAIIIDNDISPLIYPSIWKDDNAEFLYLQWEYEFCEYSLKFNALDNKEVKVSGTSMFLVDTNAEDESDHTHITLLTPIILE